MEKKNGEADRPMEYFKTRQKYMENTIIIAIVSLLCILAHVPTLILRIVPFHEKISDKDRIRLTVIYAIGLAVDFGICMWVGNYRKIDVPFYKINLIAFCIVMAAVNIWLVPGYTKVHLFVFGIVADIVMIALSIGAYVSSLLGMQGNAIGIAETSAIAIVVYALLYPLLSSLLRYTVTPFLEIECQNYWETLWFIPIAMFFSSIFSEGVDVYTTTFPQMLSKCLIGVATLLICFAVSYDQQHFLNEKELNRQIDQQKGYYHALTEQVLAEREARHNFRHQVAAIKGFLDKNDMEGLRGYCDDLELEEMGKVTIPYTGNAAADGVLYHYGCIARAKNIEFSVCCYLKDIAIPDTDFCTILGNALDNAVTAAGQYDGKRFIEVATEKKHDMLLITVDNSFDGILFQENGKIYSKKRQNKQEGIGILSMKKLCEKHGGASRFEAVGNRFQASFILKNEVED